MNYHCGNCETTYTYITLKGMSLHNNVCGRSWRIMGWAPLVEPAPSPGLVFEPAYKGKDWDSRSIKRIVPTYTNWLRLTI